MQYINHYQSPIGGITMASNGDALTGLWFDGQKYFAAGLQQNAITKNLLIFTETKRWLDIYFSGTMPHFTPPFHLEGTPFRMAVWQTLQKIPYGSTITYGDIAKLLAAQKSNAKISSQAVGGAVGHNPISIIIPCHRVIGANGNLTGYAGGIDKKIKLLQLEGINTSNFSIPQKGTAL